MNHPAPPTAPVWLFDLDNTLHHADAGIFKLINGHMTAYLARKLQLPEKAASHLRQDYWHRYGATLAGLQKHHPEINVQEFLQQSHPLPELLAALVPMPHTAATLAGLKGRKAVFSNGPSFYVAALIERMALSDYFEALLGTDDFGLLYKPSDQAYLTVCRLLGAALADCIMIDDSADNLHAAKKLGMTTLWFGQDSHNLPFVDAAIPDMAALAAWAEAVGLYC
ncbi:MAG: pyrimidine 5'-nucleotidase [Neisseria sp.]|uniref:pyrimidine 5'-nucleotidase n=1 Tax=Neisseria sp. TaxID=192066 RepID=UPI0026DDC161|nr:pyrimidine 5'-nucleotidase [Neisseria sp.]MDO4641896.1 pyrimidine 5'-nucleotidase [Neisseria sp.]